MPNAPENRLQAAYIHKMHAIKKAFCDRCLTAGALYVHI